MFRWKRKTENEAKLPAYREQTENAVRNLYEGRQNYLAIVYQAFALGDSGSIELAAEAVGTVMNGMDAAQIMRLDEQFRQYTSMEWLIDWKEVSLTAIKDKVKSREDYLWVVRLGTFHPNGFFRQKCLEELGKDPESLPYLLLRLNDWVRPIREQMARIVTECIERASVDALIAALPFLEKVKRGERRDSALVPVLEEKVGQRIRKQLENVNLYRLHQYDFRVKKYLYHLLIGEKILDKKQADDVLKWEKNSNCRSVIIREILEQYAPALEELDIYLENRSAVVRRKALDFKYAILKKDWPGLEKMLLDRSGGIRDSVRYILQKHTDFDVLQYYILHLETEYRNVAILGIGENGTEAGAAWIMPCLRHGPCAETDDSAFGADEERCVRNSVKALGKLLGEKGADVYWEFLMDDRVTVAKAAYQAVRSCGIFYGAGRLYEAFQKYCGDFRANYLLNLLMEEPSWERLPYLLLLYQYEEPGMRDRIRKKVSQRSVYGKVSAQEAEQIREILRRPELQIPPKVAEAIVFDLKFVTVKEHR